MRTKHLLTPAGRWLSVLAIASISASAYPSSADLPDAQASTETAATAPIALPALPFTAPRLFDDVSSPEAEEYSFLEQQIHAGEVNSARNQLETVVTQIEATYNRYHEDLVTPLTLLGDALMIDQEYDAAIDQYSRARHIARVSYGLFNAQQIPVVYREADAFRRVGDMQSASQREEYAYEVLHKSHSAYDAALLPGIMRLGDFYLETFNYLSARSLYNKALSVHGVNHSDYDLAAIPVLRGIARTHRLERFPPYYIATVEDARADGPVPRLNTSDLEQQHIAFNNFPAGERALQKVVEIRQKQTPEDKLATLKAIVELADWHLLFGRSNKANTLYSHVFAEMAELGEDANAFFAKPALVYLPRPQDPRPPPVSKRSERATGNVTLQFDVAPTGRIRKLKTIESLPPKLMDFRMRRSMRLAVFRPKLIEGLPATAQSHTYTHEFGYYPLRGQAVDIPEQTPPTTPEPSAEVVAEADPIEDATIQEANR